MKNTSEISQAYQNQLKAGISPVKAFQQVKADWTMVYQQKGLSEFVRTFMALEDIALTKAKDAEIFAKGFFEIIAGGGDDIDQEIAILFEQLCTKFPASIKLVAMLADVYGAIITQTQDEVCIQKLRQLNETNPTLINANLQQACALMYSHEKLDLVAYTDAVAQLKKIYERHQQLDFAKTYAQAINYLVYKQEEEEALESTVQLKDLLSQWPDQFIAYNYLDALSKLTWKQDERGCANTIAQIEMLWSNWPYQYATLAMHLAYTLANYSLCVSGLAKQAVLNRIEAMATYWQPAISMAEKLTKGTYLYAHKPQKAK